MMRALGVLCLLAWASVAHAQTPDCQGHLCKIVVTVSHAQIQQLPSTDAAIVPAPGAGKAIVLVRAYAVGSWQATDGYTNVSQVGFLQVGLYYGAEEFQASNIGDISPFRLADRPTWNFLPSIQGAPTDTPPRAEDLSADYIDNLPLNLAVTNGSAGDFTGGHSANTLTVTVYYLVVDL